MVKKYPELIKTLDKTFTYGKVTAELYKYGKAEVSFFFATAEKDNIKIRNDFIMRVHKTVDPLKTIERGLRSSMATLIDSENRRYWEEKEKQRRKNDA